MSDIVERLRAANTTLNEGDCCGQLDASGTCTAPACIFGEALKMTHDAADEITRLRAALREIDQQRYTGRHTINHENAYERAVALNAKLLAVMDIARAALKEEGDGD